MIYVTDTHPLVFWSSNRKRRLGNRARRILQETEQGKHSVIVPIVVLEEINRLVERKIVRLDVPFGAGPKNSNGPRTLKSSRIRWKFCSILCLCRQSVTRRTGPSSRRPDRSAVRSSPQMKSFKMVIGSIPFGSNRLAKNPKHNVCVPFNSIFHCVQSVDRLR